MLKRETLLPQPFSLNVTQLTNSDSLSYVKSNIPVSDNVPVSLYSCTIDGSPTSICSTKVDESGNLIFSFTTEPTSTKKRLQVFAISDPATALTSVDLPMPWVATLLGYNQNTGIIRVAADAGLSNKDFTCMVQDVNGIHVPLSTCFIPSGETLYANILGISPGTNQHVTISRMLKNTDTGAPYAQTQVVDLPKSVSFAK